MARVKVGSILQSPVQIKSLDLGTLFNYDNGDVYPAKGIVIQTPYGRYGLLLGDCKVTTNNDCYVTPWAPGTEITLVQE